MKLKSSKNDKVCVEDATVVTIILAVIFMFVGILIGYSFEKSVMRDRAIRHNAAYYDNKTSEFKWKNIKIEEHILNNTIEQIKAKMGSKIKLNN